MEHADHLQDLSIPTASYIVIYSACSTILSDYAHKDTNMQSKVW